MKLQNNLLILFIIIINSNINAQKFELGKVSIQELEEKRHPLDTSAAAAVLFKKGEVKFEYIQSEGFVIYTEVKTRIKIYKKEGYDWATNEVRFYIGNSNSEEIVSFSDAITFNLVDGKIEKTKLKSDGQFNEKINKYWGQKKITMPNVKEGSVIEYKYVIKSPTIGTLKEWSFQNTIPVNFSEYKTYIPEYFEYNKNQKGYIYPNVEEEILTKSINFSNKERSSSGGFSQVKTAYTYEKIDYEEKKITFTAQNLPALKDEVFVNNIDNYTSSISHELSMIKYPQSMPKYFSTDWETVVKIIYEDPDFGSELNKSGYFDEDIKSLLSGLNNIDEKIATIFNFVKSKIKWNGYYGYSCDEGVKTAYKENSGNVAEVNLMLIAMLRHAGVIANPVLISTRSNGIALFPNRTAFNYVIAAVEIQDKLILLDATEKFSTFNILPLRDLNWYGRLIRKDGTSSEVNLTPENISKENIFMNLVLGKDGSINGKIRKQVTDHLALSFRQNKILLKEETYLEQLENENNKIEINDYVRENELNPSEPILENYTFKDDNDVEIIGDKIYFKPLIFLSTTQNVFKQEKREYPIDFGYPIQTKYNVNIEIPQGYSIDYIPTSENIEMIDGIAGFKYLIGNQNNNVIQLSITTIINTAIVGADYYDTVKEFFQKIVDKENEKIILKKL